jgi:ligand-binding sensor domain-containing protein
MRVRTLVPAAAAAVVLVAAPDAARAGRWTNHIDASMIHEIVVRDQTLYIATFGGLLLYDIGGASFEQYRNDGGLPSNALTCLVFNADGEIYAGTEDVGMAKVRVANGRLTLLRSLSEQIDGLASNRINSVAVWGEDIVYGSTPGAGTIRNDFASARFFERDGLPGPDVFDVMPLGNEVWMATAGGVATLDRLGIIATVAGTPTDAFVLGTDGSTVWVGTNTGVRRHDPSDGSWTNLTPPPSTPSTFRIRSFFWTGDTMWAGASRNFLSYTGSGTSWNVFSPDSIQNRYQLSGGSAGREMKGLAVMPNGDVYLGTAAAADRRGPNLMRYDGANVVNLKPNAPGANHTLRLDLDVDGALWASFFDFYVGKLMPDGNWLNYNPSTPGSEIPTNAFTNIAFLADSQGHKWFSSLSDPNGPFRPLDELDDGRDASYANDVWVRHALDSGGGDGYGTLRPQRAAEDPAGNRWFVSDDAGASLGWKGIHILSRDGSAWFAMTQDRDPRMIADNVVDVAFGSTYAYVAFKSDGVYRWRHGGYDWANLTSYASDGWTPWVTASQLPAGTVITRLALAQNGRLWIASTEGLFYTDGGLLGTVPSYTGIGPGIVSPKVQDVLLDHDEDIWVATDLGLNRIARDDYNVIQTFLTPASFLLLSGLRYPLDVISPLAHADCRSLALHPTQDVLYVGTFGGISAYDFSAPPSTPTNLSSVYVYPNPVYATKGHTALKIANLTGPVVVEVYTLEGELVDSRTVSTDGDVAWDLTTRDGFNASSGTYIVRVVGESGSVQRPIALIR